MNYPFTFYQDFAVPKGSAACARGPMIFIRPKYKGDIGLYRHELEHVKQWFRTFGLHSFFYLFSKSYRLRSEVAAYKEQLKHSPGSELTFARYIAEGYDLGVTVSEAMELLK